MTVLYEPTIEDYVRGRQESNQPEIPTQTPYEIQILDLIERRFEPDHQNRLDLERRWSITGAFIGGNQWIDWDASAGRVVVRPVARRQILEKRNFMGGLHERNIAALTGFTPEYKARPNTSEHEDIQAARVATDCAQHYYDELKVEHHLQIATSWASQTGTGFIGVEWNGKGGKSWQDVSVDPETREVALNEDGAPKLETYYEGELVASSPSPFDIYVDPHATCDEDVRWMMHVTQVPLEWVDENYPDHAQFVRGDIVGHEERADKDRYGEGRRHQRWTGSEMDYGWTMRYVMYEMPTQLHPEGRMIVRCGDRVCANVANPMPDRKFPWIPLRKIIVNGSYWGRTELYDAVTPQLNLNRLVSKQLEHSMTLGLNTKMLSGGNVPESKMVSGLGEVYIWKGAPHTKPEYLAPPPLPADSDKQISRAESHLDRVSGIQGAEQGVYQGKLSGSAYEILVEQSMQQKHPGLARWRMGLSELGRKILMLCQEYVTEERTLKITGKNRQISHRAFIGADIKGNLDVRVTVRSMLPRSQAIAVEHTAKLFQSGALDPMSPHDKATGRRIIGEEEPEAAIDKMDYHREKAEREYLMARDGMPIPPHNVITQDLEVHVETHRRQANQEDFELWPQEQQMLLLSHLEETVQMALPQPGATVPPEAQQAQEQGAM